MNAAISRRGLFNRLLNPLRKVTEIHHGETKTSNAENSSAVKRVAVIQGRFCIALTSFCSVCVERCPVKGAMTKDRGMPMVIADQCTGCGICQEVCPAPRNAVLLLASRRLSAQ